MANEVDPQIDEYEWSYLLVVDLRVAVDVYL